MRRCQCNCVCCGDSLIFLTHNPSALSLCTPPSGTVSHAEARAVPVTIGISKISFSKIDKVQIL